MSFDAPASDLSPDRSPLGRCRLLPVAVGQPTAASPFRVLLRVPAGRRVTSTRTLMLWAATAYFNPQGYRCRLANYREFRSRLDVPLLAVELGFNGCFELDHRDADVLVQIDEGDVLWQKERLLNVGLAHLPGDCEAVLSIDCDVLFLSPGWLAGALNLLERYAVVQPYSVVQHLDRDWVAGRPTADHIVAGLVGGRPESPRALCCRTALFGRPASRSRLGSRPAHRGSYRFPTTRNGGRQ